jgi:hypothetical protein
MNEEQWLAATDPRPMLEALRASRKASDRKLRLFAVACCRRIDRHLKDQRSRRLVDAAELFSDGAISPEELGAAFEAAAEAQEAIHWQGGGAVDQGAAEAVLGLREDLLVGQVLEGIGEAAGEYEAGKAWEKIHKAPGKHWSIREREQRKACEAGEAVERAAQADLLRDLFGPLPFRPVVIVPSLFAWRDRTIVKLGRAVYEQRSLPDGRLDNARLAVLADALEEAGCSDKDLLGHLREQGAVHVRGCWCIDHLLAKE